MSLLLLVNSCSLFEKKEAKNALPAATQEGKHTFGCKVDGNIWLPSSENLPTIAKQSLITSYEGPVYGLNVTAFHGRESAITIQVYYVSNSGTYPLYQKYPPLLSGYPVYTMAIFNNQYGDYETDSLHTGSLVLTKLDTKTGVASGTFSFEAINKKTQQTVKITDGRFDVKFF